MKHISGQTYTLKYRNAYLDIQRKAQKLPGQHFVRKKFHDAEAPIGCQSPTKTINKLRIDSGLSMINKVIWTSIIPCQLDGLQNWFS